MLLPVAASSLSPTIGRTAATPTSISPSTTSGGMSGSNIHMGLVAVLLFNLSEGLTSSHSFLLCLSRVPPMRTIIACANTPLRLELLNDLFVR